MEFENGKRIPIPERLDEGINLRVSGANIEFNEYLLLIRRAFGAVDIQPDYFADPHPYSNVQDTERYVRLNQEVRRILREGFKPWKQANRDQAIYRAGEYRYQDREKEHYLRSIGSGMVTRRVTGRAWETLG
jgi:hypothetical protein